MIEVIILSIIGASCFFGGIIAYFKCCRQRDDEVYVLDILDSENSFTFNEIYNDKNNKAHI